MSDVGAKEAHSPRWGMRLDPTVNYGHIISATVFLATATMGWAAMSARQDHAETRIARLERVQEQMVVENQREAQIIARLDEKLAAFDRTLVRIERLLERQAQSDSR